jgi:hypothetical protein
LRIEQLEDRLVPAVVIWEGGGDGINWSDARNWSTLSLPTVNDDVIIDAPAGVTVQHASGADAVRSLRSESPFTINGGSLNTVQTSAIHNTLTLAGLTTLIVDGDLDVRAFDHQSGTLTGTGNVTIERSWQWSSGGQSGTGHTVLRGTADLNGGFSSMIDGRTIDNFGVANLTGQGITFFHDTIWNNMPGSIFSMAGGASLHNFFAESALFNNDGIIQKIGDATNSDFDIRLQDRGYLMVSTGTLSIHSGGSTGGTIDIEAGAVLAINAIHRFPEGTRVYGDGTVRVGDFTLSLFDGVTVPNLLITGGTVVLSGLVEVQSLTQSNGTVTGSGTLQVDGDWTWTGGTQGGAGHTVLLGTATLSGGFFSRIDGRTIDNHGLVGVAGTDGFTFVNASTWNNWAGSFFYVGGSGSLGNFFADRAEFYNAGLIQKAGDSGNFTIDLPFRNSGTVDVETGTLLLPRGGSSTGNFNAGPGATVALSGGTFSFEDGTFLSGAGVTRLRNGTLVVNATVSGSNFALEGGTMRLTRMGVLSLSGDYTQAPVATLSIDIAGLVPGVDFGQLNVGGTAMLDGTLAINLTAGYRPDTGDRFQILTFGSRGDPPSNFARMSGLDLGGGRRLDPVFDDNSLTLVTVG